MMVDAPSKKPFVFDKERRIAGFQRRYLMGIGSLVFRAIKGDTEQLCDYLLSEQLLTAQDREALAWLIIRKVHRNPVGRPPGRTPGPVREAEDLATLSVINARKKWCTEHDRKRLPKKVRNDLIEQAIQAVEKELPNVKGKISEHNIKMSLKSVARNKLE